MRNHFRTFNYLLCPPSPPPTTSIIADDLANFFTDKTRTISSQPYQTGSHITLQPKTGCPLKLSRVEPGQYLDGRPPEKTWLLLEEVLVKPAGGAHPVVCVGPNAPV